MKNKTKEKSIKSIKIKSQIRSNERKIEHQISTTTETEDAEEYLQIEETAATGLKQ